jgi:ankyrin repeat protein
MATAQKPSEAAGREREALTAAAIEAAIEGRLDGARAILDDSPDLARADIFAAATFGEAEAIRRFLASDLSLARAKGGPRGWEPLLYLTLSRFLGRDSVRTEGARAAARHLLDAGADPNVHTVMESPEFKQTPLYGAAGLANDPKLTRLLLEHGADPNDRSEVLGPESLYHASEHADNACLQLILAHHPDADKVSYCLGRKLDFEDPEGVRLYLLHGADPNFRTPFGLFETRLHKALLNGRSPRIVGMLLAHGADPNLETRAGHTALALAIRLGQTEAADLMRRHGADETRVGPVDRFLGACARADAAEIAQALAENPGLVDGLARADRAVLAAMAYAGRVDALRAMLAAGFDPNARGDFGTAINMAAWKGQAEAVALLAEAGADPAIVNDHGGTALGSALHGLEHCDSIEGGMTAVGAAGLGDSAGDRQEDRQEDARARRYARTIETLLEAGADPAELPARATGFAEVDAVIVRFRA